DASPSDAAATAEVWAIPTVPGGVDHLQRQVGEVVAKVGKVVARADALLAQVDREIVPEALAATKSLHGLLAADSPLQQAAGSALQQFERAAYSIRNLVDYLDRHPEALLRGRK
ncbi:MAG: hypothetical protein NT062_01040, partial [Proteobacteria bacterium]|nr:hypothetical protein [Pseudomonadota bacterium]